MLTNPQKKALHAVARRLGIDDEQRHLIQRNIGGFHSAADRTASHDGFAAVMAFYEDRAGGCLHGNTAGYWAAAHARNEARDGDGSPDRLTWRIRRTAEQLGWTELDVEAFLASEHCSSGRFVRLADANAYWLRRCLDGLQAIARRRGGKVAS